MRGKVEFQEAVDRAHQDAEASICDMAYIVRRFGNPIRAREWAAEEEDLRALFIRVEEIVRSRGI